MQFAKEKDARWVVPVGDGVDARNAQQGLDGSEESCLERKAGEIARKLWGFEKTPGRLYVIGELCALTQPNVAIVGARKATPYGLACAARFAELAVDEGFVVMTRGSRGVGTAAHRAAVKRGGATVAVLPGGLDNPYPKENHGLFREAIDHMGAIVSASPWQSAVTPHMCRSTGGLVAALADIVLVIEAGVPSGVFSLCSEAAEMERPVLAVPGAITSPQSAGSNALIASGAVTIWDDTSFLDALARFRGEARPWVEEKCGLPENRRP